MATIGSLSVKLGLVTVEWDKATDKAKKQAKDLQNAFNNLGKELNIVQKMFGSFTGSFNLAGIGIAALTAKAIGLSRDVKDMADSFGLSTAKVLEYRAALEASGVAAENTDKVLSSLFSKIDEMQSGKGIDLVEKFNKMGISLSEIAKMQPNQALEEFSKGLTKLDSDFERANIKAMFMGKGSKTFSPEAFLDNLKKVKGAYDSAGDSINRLAQLDDNLKVSMQNLTIAFADILGKFIGNDGLVVSVEKFKTIIEAVFSFYIIKQVKAFTVAIYELALAVTALDKAAKAIIPGFGTFLKIISAIEATSGEQGSAIREMIDRLKKLQEEANAPAPTEITINGGNGNGNAGKLEDAYYAQYKARLELVNQEIEFEKQSLQIKLDAYNVSEFTTRQRESQLKLQRELAKLDNEMAQELKSIPAGSERERYITDIYKARKKAAEQAYETETALAQKQYEIQTNFVEGWKNAYNQYVIESKNAGERAAESFKTLAQSLEDTLTTFFETGKLNFRSFITSIIHEIARLQAQKAAQSILGIFGGGGDFISSLFGNLNPFNNWTSGLATGGGWVPTGKASGGDINAGTPYMVGEHGPELIIPNQSGTVIPNSKMNQMMGQQNQPQIVYNGPYIANMSAIDTQSGLQFLAKNKQGVWAANQSAQRSLPQSR